MKIREMRDGGIRTGERIIWCCVPSPASKIHQVLPTRSAVLETLRLGDGVMDAVPRNSRSICGRGMRKNASENRLLRLLPAPGQPWRKMLWRELQASVQAVGRKKTRGRVPHLAKRDLLLSVTPTQTLVLLVKPSQLARVRERKWSLPRWRRAVRPCAELPGLPGGNLIARHGAPCVMRLISLRGRQMTENAPTQRQDWESLVEQPCRADDGIVRTRPCCGPCETVAVMGRIEAARNLWYGLSTLPSTELPR